ncbi:MAG: hypothetical protein MJ068_04140 [Clostridia bacterium]|nr:hypothetical protein [Clostridia bacterium]
MLSQESRQIYDILRKLTGDDDIYKIIDADEVLEQLDGMELTKVQLSAIIKDLKERDYINVKYFTPDEYCLLTLKIIEDVPLPAAKEETKQDGEDDDASKKERISYAQNEAKPIKAVKPGVVFLMAFLGAVLGSGVIAAIALVLSKIIL